MQRLFRVRTEKLHQRRLFSSGKPESDSSRNANLGMKVAAVGVLMIGATYGSVPLYRVFCAATGFGGTVQKDQKLKKLVTRDPEKPPAREVTIRFNTETSFNMPWEFKPTQKKVKVRIGETALAFFTAKNNSDKPVVGVASYNVTPMRAGIYFNKIQCFCFDEQRLRAGEQIDMPVFFFLDPEMEDDPRMNVIDDIVLSYTFYPAPGWDEDESLPAPVASID